MGRMLGSPCQDRTGPRPAERMFNLESEPQKPIRSASGGVTVCWTWPVDIRLMLAVAVLVCSVGLRASIWLQGSDSAAAYRRVPDLVIDPNTSASERPGGVAASRTGFGEPIDRGAQNSGRSKSTEDLRRRVRGLGPVTLSRLSPYLQFQPVSKTGSRNVGSRAASTRNQAAVQPRLAQAQDRPESLMPSRLRLTRSGHGKHSPRFCSPIGRDDDRRAVCPHHA